MRGADKTKVFNYSVQEVSMREVPLQRRCIFHIRAEQTLAYYYELKMKRSSGNDIERKPYESSYSKKTSMKLLFKILNKGGIRNVLCIKKGQFCIFKDEEYVRKVMSSCKMKKLKF